MPDSAKIYEVKCPSCGAPLHMTGERSTCDYCGAVLERPRPAVQEPAAPPPRKAPQPQVVVIQSEYATRPRRAQSGGSSCFATLLTLLIIVGAIGAVVWFQFRNQLPDLAGLSQLPEKIFNTVSITTLSEVILLPSGKDGSPDFLTFTYNTGAQTYTLSYIETLGSTIRWHSPPLKEWYSASVLESPTILYTTDETKLLALSRSDGQLLWQTSMADKVVPNCLNCFNLVGNQLVVLVQGGTVQGFNSQTGQLIWSKPLNNEAANRLVVAGDQLLIFDRSQDHRRNLMYEVNPANGEVISELTIPECAGERFDQYYPNFYNASRGELYLIFGDIIGPACLQVWQIASQSMARQIVLEGVTLPSDFREYAHELGKAMLGGEMLYFSANQKVGQSEQSTVIGANIVDGQWRAITQAADYELTPLAVSDSMLIVRASRSRGSARSELWGVDLASGEPRWQAVLQVPRWYKETGSGGVWDWHLTPQGLVVLQLFSDPDQLLVETLNPQTGVSSGQKTIALADDFLSGIAWTNDAAWLAIRKIYKVDLATGTLAYTWP